MLLKEIVCFDVWMLLVDSDEWSLVFYKIFN